eukprot:15335757-Ditylum_brightwellii.AAC.1
MSSQEGKKNLDLMDKDIDTIPGTVNMEFYPKYRRRLRQLKGQSEGVTNVLGSGVGNISKSIAIIGLNKIRNPESRRN